MTRPYPTGRRQVAAAAAVGASVLALAAPRHSQAGPFQFTDVTAEAGILHTHSHPPNEHPYGFTDQISFMSGGAVAEDFDGDGRLDLYVLQGGKSANLLYINQGGGIFAEEAATRGADLVHYGMGVAAADYDNDGDIDIVVTVRNSPAVLLRNTGLGHFAVVPLDPPPLGARSSMSPSWGDIDNNGLLDLAIGQWEYSIQGLYLYRTEGQRLALTPFQLEPHLNRLVFAPRFADLNQDRRADLPVVADFWQSQLYLHVGDQSYARVTGASGTGFDENGMGSAIGDYDNDGDLDWFVSSIFAPSTSPTLWKIGNRLYRNRGNGVFDDVSEEAGIQDGNWGWGSAFGDLDNDGDLDLYHVNGWPGYPPGSVDRDQFILQPARLFENLGDGTFTNVAAGTGADHTGQGRGVLLFDYDEDGDLDIFICNNMESMPHTTFVEYTPGIPALLRNDSPVSNYWLKVTLAGIPPYHRNGIGSRVYVTTGESTQMRELHASTGFLSQGPGRIAHFGLGSHPVAEEVRAEWNTGDAVVRFGVLANQAVSLPSPSAVLSARTVMPGQPVTASAPVGAGPVEWWVDGVAYADPVTVAFHEPGTHELVMQTFEPDGLTPAAREILRVSVPEFTAAAIGGTATPEQFAIHWLASPGRLYHVQSASTLGAEVWSAAAAPMICTTPGPLSAVVTPEPATTGYYRVHIDPTPNWPAPE